MVKDMGDMHELRCASEGELDIPYKEGHKHADLKSHAYGNIDNVNKLAWRQESETLYIAHKNDERPTA